MKSKSDLLKNGMKFLGGAAIALVLMAYPASRVLSDIIIKNGQEQASADNNLVPGVLVTDPMGNLQQWNPQTKNSYDITTSVDATATTFTCPATATFGSLCNDDAQKAWVAIDKTAVASSSMPFYGLLCITIQVERFKTISVARQPGASSAPVYFRCNY